MISGSLMPLISKRPPNDLQTIVRLETSADYADFTDSETQQKVEEQKNTCGRVNGSHSSQSAESA